MSVSSATSSPIDLTKLAPEEKALAVAYVLSREDIKLPTAPTTQAMVQMARDDIRRSLQRFKEGKPNRFANLFGSIGALGGVVAASIASKNKDDRGKWSAVIVGATIGTYPAAFAGFLIDKVVDPLTGAK